MEAIRSVDQCKELISVNRKRFPKVDTNCMMMAGGFAPQIEEGRLYYGSYENGLCLYSDEGRYYELFYFWDREAGFDDFRQDKTVIVGEVSDRGRRDAYIERFGQKACAAGFQFFKKNLQIELKLKEHVRQIEEHYAQSMARMEQERIRFARCGTREMERQVLALWYGSLDETDVPLKHARFMEHGEDTVLCALNDGGEVVGAYWWGPVKRGTVEARHVVTREDHYRKGIGTALTFFCMKELLDQDYEMWRGFVATENERSLRMHEKIGCELSGMTITQYILQGE